MFISDYFWLIPIFSLAGLWIWVMFAYPKLWITTSLLGLTYFLTSDSVGIKPEELVLAGYYILVLLLWFIVELAKDYRTILRSWPDFLLISFIVLSLGNVLVAMGNSVGIDAWASEWSLFVLMLIVFPVRKYFTADEKSVKQFLTILAISVCIMSVQSILNYRSRLAEGGALYAYQIWSGRSVLLGPAFQACMVFSMISYFFVNRKGKLFSFVVFIISTSALIATFSRTLWVTFFICLAIALVFLGFRRSTKLVCAIVVISIVSYGGFYLYKPKIAKIALTVASNRLKSSSQLTGGDYSFETRLIEVKNITPKIKALPLGGNGIRSKYVTWVPLAGSHGRTAFVHIGYASIVYKLGFPLSILLLLTICSYFFAAMVASYDAFRSRNNTVYAAISYSLTAYFPALLLTILTAGFFDTRYGNVIFGIMFACSAIVQDYFQKKPALPQTLTSPTSPALQ